MIGSLELLQSSNVLTLFNTSDPAMRTGARARRQLLRYAPRYRTHYTTM